MEKPLQARAPQQTLLVIGAGPKAIALAAKRAALIKVGISVPELVVVDYRGLVANWSGHSGFTDGRQLLGTRPEKDIGFPYASTCWGSSDVNRVVDNEMLKYSWQSYLVNTGRYVDWIDRGRTRPTHREWSQYLLWVAKQTGISVVRAEVRTIALSNDQQRWRLTCRVVEDDSAQIIEGDGLVITGPGTPITIPGQPEAHPRVMDGDSFWLNIETFVRLRCTITTPLHIGVIGTGETAAAIVISLLHILGDAAFIEVISPYGVLYSRDEGFEENRLFSDPDARLARLGGHQHELSWLSMTENNRREFVRRTDRGVFSLHAMEEVNRAENVRTIMGSARRLHAEDDGVTVDIEYNSRMASDHYDYVIVAIGFNPLWFINLLDERAATRLREVTQSLDRTAIEHAITEDLSIANFVPRLHLPMLAGVAQGPGFPNLSSLGLLSDRILFTYASFPPGS